MVRAIDLTRTIEYGMPVFEKRIRPMLVPWARLDLHGYDLELIFMSTHTGTHMDAPSHFIREGISIDAIPLSVLVSDAVLAEVRKGEKEYIYREDLLRELEHSNLKGECVIISTGWEEKWEDEENYLSGNPGLSRDAAEYLVEKGVTAIGVDTANIDHPDDKEFTVHRILLSSNVPIVENLCNLKAIGSREFRFIALPLKIKGSTGSPVRALALID
ncbi:MAG: cyclase family protein [Candidatus Nitrosocaldus sp.]